MLKVLLKKQLTEVFRMYYYDAKRNKPRSKAGTIGMFILFFVLMFGFLGGMFTFLSVTLCEALVPAGLSWFYFLIFTGLAILFGAFGSVFNTFAGLYLGKDNDFLLSMPIPIKYIVLSRLLNVYLMGTMYSGIVILPALIVYWVIGSSTLSAILCGLALFLVISFAVLILSCLLGWVVAKISVKLKNKSIITVLIALACIALYYFLYFKMTSYMTVLLENADAIGEKVKGSAYLLYLFGQVGTGENPLATLLWIGIIAVLCGLTWLLLKGTFLSIATMGGKSGKVKTGLRDRKRQSSFRALIGKELAHFLASPTYMLNSGLGIILAPALGLVFLIKGGAIMVEMEAFFDGAMDFVAVLASAALALTGTMTLTTPPSVSLEGRSIWLAQSLPVEPKKVLQSKLALNLILSGIPVLFTSICILIVLRFSWALRILCVLCALSFSVFTAIWGLFWGVKMPNLVWTNEVIPIKQGGAVVISLFSMMGLAMLYGGGYLLAGLFLPGWIYMLIWTVLLLGLSVVLLNWINTKGARKFADL